MLSYSYIPSPLGDILVAGAFKEGRLFLCHVNFPTAKDFYEPKANWIRDDSLFRDTKELMDTYFSGEPLPKAPALDLQGSPFQQEVWRALLEIPFGQVATYGELAERIGKPGASRAIGLANGSNPCPLIVPCHRVVAANNRLGGFSSGLANKRFLLRLEGHAIDDQDRINNSQMALL